MSTLPMQPISVALAAALRRQPQEPNRRDELRDRARCSRRQELLTNLRTLRALAQRARIRKCCKLALPRLTKPSARVLTIFTILALARPTSSPDHLHHFRLRSPDILAFIASTAVASIASANITAAQSFNLSTFAHLPISTPTASITAAIAATIAAIGGGDGGGSGRGVDGVIGGHVGRWLPWSWRAEGGPARGWWPAGGGV